MANYNQDAWRMVAEKVLEVVKEAIAEHEAAKHTTAGE